MLFAKWLLEHDPDAGILVVTDRDELDTQIEGVMKNAGVIGADSPSPRITSRREFVETRKDIKHVHLSVHPPGGRVTLVAPIVTRPEVARAYAVSRLAWIRKQQALLRGQAREASRRFVTRESHYVWGKRYLLTVVERDQKPSVTFDHRRITLSVRPERN